MGLTAMDNHELGLGLKPIVPNFFSQCVAVNLQKPGGLLLVPVTLVQRAFHIASFMFFERKNRFWLFD